MTRWLRKQFAVNRPYDELVRDLLLAQGSTLSRRVQRRSTRRSTHRRKPAVRSVSCFSACGSSVLSAIIIRPKNGARRTISRWRDSSRE